MPMNKEVLVVGMYDPIEGKTKLFIDGERVAEMATTPPASDPNRKIVSFGGHCQNGEQWVGTITMPAIFRRALTDAEVMELARKSTLKPVALSGTVPLTPSAPTGSALVIGTASVGGGKVFQSEVGPDGGWEAVAQDIAMDISYAGVLAAGRGYLAGGFPDGITKVEGVPASAEVRVLYRGDQGQLGDGVLVAEVQSNEDGTWLVQGLDPDLKFDVICRYPGYNDMILSNVSPVLATGLEFAGSFATLGDQVEILLGVGPYQVDVIAGTPPLGVTFSAVGDVIVATGEAANLGIFTFTLRVIDSNGLSGIFSSTLEVVAIDPYWDSVVSLLHFDGDLTDETGRVWESVGSSVVSSDESVFGGSSLKVPTTSGLVRAADSADFDFGSEDFTIEFFLRPTSVTPWATYLDKRESGSFHAPFAIQRDSSTNRMRFSSAYMAGSWAVVITPTHPPLNVWTHVVYQRRGGVFQVFLGGIQVGSVDGGSNSLLTNNATLNIGADGSNSHGMVGYIDELRITKGVARYTENFTPPTTPFPNRGP